jgi:hypothetical protein
LMMSRSPPSSLKSTQIGGLQSSRSFFLIKCLQDSAPILGGPARASSSVVPDTLLTPSRAVTSTHRRPRARIILTET